MPSEKNVNTAYCCATLSFLDRGRGRGEEGRRQKDKATRTEEILTMMRAVLKIGEEGLALIQEIGGLELLSARNEWDSGQ